MQGFGGLSLTEQSRAVLKGVRNVTLREEVELPKKSRTERTAERSVERARKNGAEISAADEPLWQALREARSRIAREQGVPPYVIFHDTTLLEILRSRPRSQADMANIPGVGATKLSRYGQVFIEVVTAF
jgi:ATP-dependent DNA helicase RecQ